MSADEYGYLNSLTERALGAIFEVSNTLGAGFLEKVYQRALLAELRLRGIQVLIEDVLVIELKCAERLSNEHTAQCLNYLRASGRTLCLLVNFQKPKVEWKRIVNGLRVPEPIEALPVVATFK